MLPHHLHQGSRPFNISGILGTAGNVEFSFAIKQRDCFWDFGINVILIEVVSYGVFDMAPAGLHTALELDDLLSLKVAARGDSSHKVNLI